MASTFSSPTRHRLVLATLYVALLGGGCSSGGDDEAEAETPGAGSDAGPKTDSGAEPTETDAYLDPPTPVEVEVKGEALTAIAEEQQSVRDWDAQTLLDTYAPHFEPAAEVDPGALLNYDLLQASPLALVAEEEEILRNNGLVILKSPQVATFSYGYRSVYAQDLPVFVSADSVLDAVHRSYDDILKDLEGELLVPTLTSYLSGVRAQLEDSDAQASVRAEADFFLAVAQSLLQGEQVLPAFDASFQPAELKEFVDAAKAATGILEKTLFGVRREIDFSQFEPRGHYRDSELLSRYFQAMMWLGRTDLRLLETLPTGEQVLRRNQVEIAFVLRDLMAEKQRQEWALIDRIVTAFIGEHDYMVLPELDALQQALGFDSLAELDEISDQDLAQAIVDGQYGAQRIASQVIRSQIDETLPLSASFALFGQRYTVDSHVFSQVTYSRAPRVLPDPLDAAFAALGNNQAASLLQSELERWPYAPQLAGIRKLIDRTPDESWNSSLYTLWLGSLRQLSAGALPAGAVAASDAAPEPTAGSGLPKVALTEAWGRRLLNTQLGSWAQLRHDTLLYVKQSYTDGSDCEFPDAYVDPYPEFWASLIEYAERGSELLDGLDTDSAVLTEAQAYFSRFSGIVAVLQRMAEHQLTGQPHSADDLAFINNAVRITEGGSGPPTIEGWYHQLLYRPYEFGDVDNVVADVHTDVGGERPIVRGPSVLHVGTHYPRLMVTAIDTCEGPRVYVGPVYAFEQYVAEGVTRLNDEEWQALLHSETPPEDVTWMTPLLGPVHEQ